MPQKYHQDIRLAVMSYVQRFLVLRFCRMKKFRGVRVNLVVDSEMRITANNPEQEEAEEVLDVTFDGDALEIGFNVSYVLDGLNTLRCEQVRISMSDANASALD
ncbi:hypothetical protein O9993_14500 [Vibrio lentus]|nr:hypothetical protein [Vibrio lentus]